MKGTHSTHLAAMTVYVDEQQLRDTLAQIEKAKRPYTPIPGHYFQAGHAGTFLDDVYLCVDPGYVDVSDIARKVRAVGVRQNGSVVRFTAESTEFRRVQSFNFPEVLEG